jgi:hypothetical protein
MSIARRTPNVPKNMVEVEENTRDDAKVVVVNEGTKKHARGDENDVRVMKKRRSSALTMSSSVVGIDGDASGRHPST